MGFFSGLDTEAYDREYKDRELLKRIFEYLNHIAADWSGFHFSWSWCLLPVRLFLY